MPSTSTLFKPYPVDAAHPRNLLDILDLLDRSRDPDSPPLTYAIQFLHKARQKPFLTSKPQHYTADSIKDAQSCMVLNKLFASLTTMLSVKRLPSHGLVMLDLDPSQPFQGKQKGKLYHRLKKPF